MMGSYPKPKTDRSPRYLKWLRSQPCVICGRYKDTTRDVVPAHQTIKDRGVSLKPSDYYALPLCSFCHAEEHYGGVKTMWKGLDRKLLIIDHLIMYFKDEDRDEKHRNHKA